MLHNLLLCRAPLLAVSNAALQELLHSTGKGLCPNIVQNEYLSDRLGLRLPGEQQQHLQIPPGRCSAARDGRTWDGSRPLVGGTLAVAVPHSHA